MVTQKGLNYFLKNFRRSAVEFLELNVEGECAAFVTAVSCHSIILVQCLLMTSQDDDESVEH